MYQVSKQYAQHTMFKGRRTDIGPFRTFTQARRECQQWMDADHKQLDHDAQRAPRGAGAKYAVDEHGGDARYWIEKVKS